MDKTIFELVPVSVKPEKEGWYDLIDPEGGLKAGSYYFYNGNWYDNDECQDRFQLTAPSTYHYLRPLPPHVTEERTFTLAEMIECWKACSEWDNNDGPPSQEWFKKRFNITL